MRSTAGLCLRNSADREPPVMRRPSKSQQRSEHVLKIQASHPRKRRRRLKLAQFLLSEEVCRLDWQGLSSNAECSREEASSGGSSSNLFSCPSILKLIKTIDALSRLKLLWFTIRLITNFVCSRSAIVGPNVQQSRCNYLGIDQQLANLLRDLVICG